MARGVVRLGCVVVVLVAGLLVFGGVVCGGAVGAAVHHFSGPRITEVPEAAGHGGAVALPGPLSSVAAMAEVGDELWVAERDEQFQPRVDMFAVEGAAAVSFEEQLPAPPSTVGEYFRGIAVASPAGQEQVLVGGVEAGSHEGLVAVYCRATKVWCGVWSGALTGAGKFGLQGVEGLAVDGFADPLGSDWAAGDVYVADFRQGVYVFAPQQSGAESVPVAVIEGGLAGTPEWSPARVAVDDANGDVLVADEKHDVVDVFEPEVGVPGKYRFVKSIGGPPGEAFGTISSIVVDPENQDVYVGLPPVGPPSARGSVVDEFNAAKEYRYLGQIAGTEVGSPPETFSAVRSLAVDDESDAPRLLVGDERNAENKNGITVGFIDGFGADEIVPEVETLPASPVTARGATLRGTVNAEGGGQASCEFAWGASEALENTGVACEQKVSGESTVPVAVELSSTEDGVLPDTTYFYRLQASNANGLNPGLPVQTHSFTTLGPGLHGVWASEVSDGAARLSAQVDPHGQATSCFFEYVTQAGYEASGFASATRTPTVILGSGEANVLVNETVARLAPGTAYRYRLVVQSEVTAGNVEEFPEKEGEYAGEAKRLETESVGAGLVLPDGRQWEMVTPADKHGALIFQLNGNEDDAIQAAADGQGIAYEALTPVVEGAQGYPVLEQELSIGNGGGGWGTENISPAQSEPGGVGYHTPQFMLFSENLQTAVVEQHNFLHSLLSEEASEQTPYLWQRDCAGSDKACFTPLVSGKGECADVPASVHFAGEASNPGWFRGASPDLQHIILKYRAQLTSTPTSGQVELYEWSAQAPCTSRLQLISVLPESEGGKPAETQTGGVDVGTDPSLTVASNGPNEVSDDGSRIYWSAEGGLYMRDTSIQKTIKITADGGSATFQWASPQIEGASRSSRVLFTEAGELYECEITQQNDEDTCKLTDLTPERGREDAQVQPVILGAGQSEEGNFAYFVAKGTLGQPHAVSGGYNLFADHNGSIAYIATLAAQDAHDWGGDEVPQPQLGEITAGASEDGRFLAFISSASLTGYDNTSLSTGQPVSEVYIYNATTGHLACASCNPTGARPLGPSSIPGWTILGPFNEALRRSRYIFNNGRLFFDSQDALVAQDTNHTTDVYEYEPANTGNCTTTLTTYNPETSGCLALISSGSSHEPTTFMEASENGNDVFFLTDARLTNQDTDTALDIYDAHVCSPQAPCPTTHANQPTECESPTSCHTTTTPPETLNTPLPTTILTTNGNIPPPPPADKTKTHHATKPAHKQQTKKHNNLCQHTPKNHKHAHCSSSPQHHHKKSPATKRHG